MSHTLIIDTSFGSTVGVLGHEPVVEKDSRTHVERLQANIGQSVAQAGLDTKDIDRIVVGIGPAPFTGLRVGVVTAKALAYATGARLLGQDILQPQMLMAYRLRRGHVGGRFDRLPEVSQETHGKPYSTTLSEHNDDSVPSVFTLCVNDARRRQLYFSLYDGNGKLIIPMDIDYPAHIAQRVNEQVGRLTDGHEGHVLIDVIGHGAGKYEADWRILQRPGQVIDASVLDLGARGLRIFADCAFASVGDANQGLAVDGIMPPTWLGSVRRNGEAQVEPLYLRRPDVSVPNPLKHVLNSNALQRNAA